MAMIGERRYFRTTVADQESYGSDIAWPDEEQDGDAFTETFSAVVHMLRSKGYCVIQMPSCDAAGLDVSSNFKHGRTFAPLSAQTGEAYLGCGSSRSKVACIEHEFVFEDDALSNVVRRVTKLGDYLGVVSQPAFGFTAAGSIQGHSASGVMLREESPHAQSSLAALLESGDDSDNIESVLSFVRRRKICLMYFIQGCDGGCLHLEPWEDKTLFYPVSLPVYANKLLLFRHDLMNYAYEPQGKDLVLQAWVLREPLIWPGGALMGTEEDIKAALRARGAPIPSINHVQVKSLSCKIGGKGNGVIKTENVYLSCTDCFIKIPQRRWDHDLYWSPNRDDGRGLSGVRHSGLCSEDDICAFDNVKFRIPDAFAERMSPSNFINLECGYEALHEAKYTLRKLKGANIDIAIGGNSRDGDFVHRYMNNKFDATSQHYLESHVISFYFGTTGKSWLVDTACSASNIAFQSIYQDIRRGRDAKKYKLINEHAEDIKGLAMGSMFVNDAGAFVGLSQAHMLGSTGRSKTFDNSADGYARGEGVGAAFLQRDDNVFESYGYVLGGITNQDGRSASLTAPNGPSQSAVIRGSLKDSGRHYLDVNVSELHGTGTAIGDPIETGSLRMVMFPGRSVPIIHQAGKSMTGHLEFGAGITGIIKTLLCGMHSTAIGNCHLRTLNVNVDMNGYPGIWPNEIVDTNRELNHCGISSFGFGGSNARVDLWASCKRGGHSLAPLGPTASGFVAVIDRPHRIDSQAIDVFLAVCSVCRRSMCWMCGEIAATLVGGTKHQCKVVRQLYSGYDTCNLCYAGPYLIGTHCSGDAGDPGRAVYIVGSWSNFAEYEEMQSTGEGYEINIDLKNLRYAEFRIVLDKYPDLSLYPAHRLADCHHHIQGPDNNCQGRSWLIDVGNFCSGSSWKIEFKWEYGGKKSISWQMTGCQLVPVEENRPNYTVVGKNCISGQWQSQDFVHSDMEDGLWEASFPMGVGGAEFQIMVDHDDAQIIHPDGCKVVDVSEPMLGPGRASSDKTWFILGLHGEEVKLELRSNPNGMSLTVISKTVGKRTWYTRNEARQEHRYFLAGTFNEWNLDFPMELDAFLPLPTNYRRDVKIGPTKSHYFKIVVDKNPKHLLQNCVLHGRGISYTCLQDVDGAMKYGLHGPHGAEVAILLRVGMQPPELTFQILGVDPPPPDERQVLIDALISNAEQIKPELQPEQLAHLRRQLEKLSIEQLEAAHQEHIKTS